MKKTITLLATATLLFAACDKITPDIDGTYTTFAGISATWNDGDAVEAVQHALVEKFTGPKCTNCPDADVTLDAAHATIGDQLVVISINHPVGLGVPYNGDPDMRCDDGTTWDNYYGINGIPSAYINRDKSRQYSSNMSNITADLQSAIAKSPVLGLNVSADSSTDGSAIDVTVGLQFVQEVKEPMKLTLALIEDSLVYRQANGETIDSNYVHNHMLRDVMTDVWGAVVDATGTAGEKRKAVFSSYRVKDSSIKLKKSHVVAFVTYQSSGQVINTACCKIQ